MIKITNLHAAVEGNEILRGVDLQVNAGEVHAIMGPNGSGKSTLAQALAGHPAYEITSGTVEYKGKDLLDLDAAERAREGIFLAFQYPVEIPGVTNTYFLKNALNAVLEHQGKDRLDAMEFHARLKEQMTVVEMPKDLLKRPVNHGFSGGEKKRNEIFQMLVLNPTLAILDETDSGLDIDALRIVSKGVNHFRGEDKGVIMVTHYQRLLDYIEPDFVHVLMDGKLVKSGTKELALELEERGYDWIREELATAEA